MGNTDSIPVISQVKSLGQVIGGDKEGARRTQENFVFKNTVPVLSQASSLIHVIGGRPDKAKDLQKEFAKGLEKVVDSIPVAGHVKGVVHFAVGDKDRGEQVFQSANRATAVALGGVGGFAVGGPAGAVAGGIAAGVAVDGLHTGIEVAKRGPDKARKQGIIGLVDDLKKNGKEGAAGKIFDEGFGVVMDGVSGLTAGKAVGGKIGGVGKGGVSSATKAVVKRVPCTGRRRKRDAGPCIVMAKPVQIPSNPKIATDVGVKLPSPLPSKPNVPVAARPPVEAGKPLPRGPPPPYSPEVVLKPPPIKGAPPPYSPPVEAGKPLPRRPPPYSPEVVLKPPPIKGAPPPYSPPVGKPLPRGPPPYSPEVVLKPPPIKGAPPPYSPPVGAKPPLTSSVISGPPVPGSLPKRPLTRPINAGSVAVGTVVLVGNQAESGPNDEWKPEESESKREKKEEQKEKKKNQCDRIVRGINLIQNDDPPKSEDPARAQVDRFINTECLLLELETVIKYRNGALDYMPVERRNSAHINNPVQGVFLLPQDGNGQRLPVMLRAVLTQAGLPNCPRNNFGDELDRMTFMDARVKEREPNLRFLDERGHILASQLCGPAEWYNLAPQTPRVNRNLGYAGENNAWREMEAGLRRFFDNRCGTVIWNVHILYNTIGEQLQSHRPRAFKTCPFFIDPNNQRYHNNRPRGMYSDNSR